MQRFHFMIYFWVTLSIKKDDSLNPSSSLKVLWKPLTIDFTWIYCTVIIIALSPEPETPTMDTREPESIFILISCKTSLLSS